MQWCNVKQNMKADIKQCYGVILRFCSFVVHRFSQDKLTYTAAALAFTSMLSVVPLMTVSFAVLKAFPAFQEMGNQVTNFMFTHFVPASGNELRVYLDNFIAHSAQLTSIGSLFLFVTALLTMWTIERAFNDIWRVQRSRSGISALLLYWAVLTMTPLLFGISLVVSTYLVSLPLVSDTANTLGFGGQLLAMIAFTVEFIGLVILYTAVPNTRVNVKHACVGGLVAAILFEISKSVFASYVSSFPTYELIYGALASIPLLLIWIYCAWIIILLGAEITNALAYEHSEKLSHAHDKFIMAYFWVGHLYQAQKVGQGLSLASLLQLQGSDAHVEPEEIINELVQNNIISQLSNGDFVLLRDLNQMTLLEFYQTVSWQLPHAVALSAQQHPFQLALTKVLANTDKAIANAMNMAMASCFEMQSK